MLGKRVHTWVGGFLLGAALAACGGAAQEVEFSGCKTERAPTSAALVTQALSSVDSSAYDGLSCFSWERQGSRVQFAALNFGAGCGVEWEGQAVERRDGGYDFVISDPDCKNLRCGSCLYDVAFEIDTDKLDEAVELGFTLQRCGGGEQTIGSWQLQAGAASKQTRCTYAAALTQGHMGGSCGATNTPCRTHCNSATAVMSVAPCDPGLTCTAVGNSAICMSSCERDEDCALPDATSCTNGVCRLRGQ